MENYRVIEIKQSVFADNDQDANRLRQELKENKTFLLNLMSSPGSGKTTTLKQTISRMKNKYRMAVMEADIDSDVDAAAIADTGIRTIQLHTGGMCHLDADMTRQGLRSMGIQNMDIAILENVGNLVCPAEFDTGAVKNAMILSVPEGHDKPLKYPLIFQVCDALIINKIDVLPYFDFDLEKVISYAHMRNPELKIFPISAKTGEGIQQLLEMILLTAEVMELKANPNRMARGIVLEAQLDKGRGPVASVLVQKGTLHVGDFVSAGSSSGKVRAMIDDKGRRVKEAGPSMPVEILGLSDVPEAGDVFLAHESDKEAKSYAEAFIEQNKEKKLEETKSRMSLDDLFNQIQEGNLKELNLIVKADVQGSVEAVKQSLTKLSNEEIVVKCIHGGVGAINESDVTLASASNAIIIGFNVRPDATAKATAETEGVDIRLYKVIYQAIEDVEAAMKGMLDPVYEEKIIGHAEVRQIFKASAIGNIAGSYVLDGVFTRGCKVRITREGELIYEGALASLKRFKDDVKEVKAGFECGLVFEGFDKMKEFDVVEAYIMVEVPR